VYFPRAVIGVASDLILIAVVFIFTFALSYVIARKYESDKYAEHKNK